MRQSRLIFGVLIAIVTLSFGDEASAQSRGIHFKGSFEAIVNCDQPILLRNFTVSGAAAGVIYPDRTGSADLNVNAFFSEQIHFDARLGHWIAVPGGTGRMLITGHNHLQLVMNFPNNFLITDIAIRRGACQATLSSRLKPGKRQYTLYHLNTFYYCSKPQVVSTTCEVN